MKLENLYTSFAFFPFSPLSRALRPPSLTCLMMRRSLTEAMARGRARARTKPCSRKSRRRIWKPSASGKRPFSKLRSVTSSHHGFVSWECRILALCLAQREGKADLHRCQYSVAKNGESVKDFQTWESVMEGKVGNLFDL